MTKTNIITILVVAMASFVCFEGGVTAGGAVEGEDVKGGGLRKSRLLPEPSEIPQIPGVLDIPDLLEIPIPEIPLLSLF